MITRDRSRRRCSSPERRSRTSSSGELVLRVATSPHLASMGQSPKMMGKHCTRRGPDWQGRNKTNSFRARETEPYPGHSSEGRQTWSTSIGSMGSLQENVSLDIDDEASDKRNHHDDLRWHRPTRRRRCSGSGINTSKNCNSKRPQSRKRHSLSAAEVEWAIGHRLVKSVRAAFETIGSDSPKRPREQGPAERDTLPSTQQSTPRPKCDLAQAGDVRDRASDSGIEFGKLNDDLLKPVVCVDEAGRNSEKVGELTSRVAKTPSDRLFHDRCATCVGNDAQNDARGATNEDARAAPSRTRRSRRARHCEAWQDCGCGVLFGDGCRCFTKAEMLVARHLLLAVRAIVREGTHHSLHKDGLQFSRKSKDKETRARNVKHLHVVNNQEASEDILVAVVQKKVGEEGSEKTEGRKRTGIHAVSCCQEAEAGAAQGGIGAGGNDTAPPDCLETESSRSGSVGDVQEEQHTPAPPGCTDAGSGEGPDPVAPPCVRKTIAEQVDEVSARLDRIFVLPLT